MILFLYHEQFCLKNHGRILWRACGWKEAQRGLPPTPNSQTLEPGEGLVTFKQVFWNFHIAPQSELNLLKFWLYVNAATFSCPLPAASYLPLPLDQRRVLSTLAWTFGLTSKWGQWRSNPYKLLYIPIYEYFVSVAVLFNLRFFFHGRYCFTFKLYIHSIVFSRCCYIFPFPFYFLSDSIFSHFLYIFRVLSTVELSSRSLGQHLPWMNQPRRAWRSYYTLLITTTTTFENVWIIL